MFFVPKLLTLSVEAVVLAFTALNEIVRPAVYETVVGEEKVTA